VRLGCRDVQGPDRRDAFAAFVIPSELRMDSNEVPAACLTRIVAFWRRA